MADNFELVCKEVSNGVVEVSKYRSKRTGLTFCLADVEGPLVNGFFCLATEAHDDDGLPHTLEHLIFLGSEDYPYKGVLDMLANRCLARGTNAWTDTDHTCYTVMTAGSQGFLNLMPIYIDHILYPTLTDSAYVTEVHHINEDGEDAGVVYCEMQARENTGESRSHLAMLRAMYPGKCGYKSETGGIMANLRTSTTNAKVRSYHKSFYRPDNLCLVITGKVTAEEVFTALEPVEQKIVSKGSLPPYNRPWQSPVPPLEESVFQTVPYPSDDEANGMVYLGWRGPQAKELYAMAAVGVLMEYLTDTSVSPLQRDFVEIESPYCSKVKYSMIEATDSCVYLKFNNVPKDKLDLVKDRLFEVLKGLADGTEQIDMARMQSVIHRQILDELNSMEEHPHDTFAFMCIGDFLYGNNNEELKKRLNQVEDYKKMKDEPVDFWITFLKKYFVGTNSVTIVGSPSKQLADDMAEEEKQRIAKQKEALGEKGLKRKADELEDANDENETEAPDGMLSSVPIPDTSSFNFHPLKRHNNLNGTTEVKAMDISKLPFTFQLDDVGTNFVEIGVFLDTSNLSAALKPYLPLYLELLFESPVLRNGESLTHEQVIKELAADTLSTASMIGVDGGRFTCGLFSQLATVNIKVEVEKYAKGVAWLQELLYQVQFKPERLKVVATKMINDVAQMKRSGSKVVTAVLKNMNFSKESNHYVSNMMRQHAFLTKMIERLDKYQDQVLEELSKVQEILTSPSNLRIHMTANLKVLESVNPLLPWKEEFVDRGWTAKSKCIDLKKRAHELLKKDSADAPKGTIIGVGSVESSFLIQSAPGVTGFDDPDLPAIMVFIECLCALEGPMWKQIRGLGFAYHYSMQVGPESGLIYLHLHKCSHVVSAYKQAQLIIDEYLTGKEEFDELQVETAISSVLYEVIEREETVSSTSDESMLNYFRKTDQDYNRTLLKKISEVTIPDLERVGKKYFGPLMDHAVSRCAICCQPSKVDEIKDGFKSLSRDLHVIPSLEEAFSD